MTVAIPLSYQVYDGSDLDPIEPDVIWTDAGEIARSDFGVSAGPDGPNFAPLDLGGFQKAIDFRGIGLSADHDGKIFYSWTSRNYIGAKLNSSDSFISHCQIENSRDAGIWIAQDAGHCKTTKNHCFGARIGMFNKGGDYHFSARDTFADTLIGFCTNGGEGSVQGGFFQHNAVRDAVLRGGNMCLDGCTIYSQREVNEQSSFNVPTSGLPTYSGKVSIEIAGGCSIKNGILNMNDWKHPQHTYTGNPTKGIYVNGSDTKISDLEILDNDLVAGTTAVTFWGATARHLYQFSTRGFYDSTAKLFTFGTGATVRGLNATVYLDQIPSSKRMGDYVGNGDWKGIITLVDLTTNRRLIETR